MSIEEKYDEVKELILMGKERGYLLYDEVNDILPEEVNSPEEIDDIASSGKSLMPDGMEQKITPQEMADLIAFLKNWRYLDGTVPLGR